MTRNTDAFMQEVMGAAMRYGMEIRLSGTQDGETTLTFSPVGAGPVKPPTATTAARKPRKRRLPYDKNRVTRVRTAGNLTARQAELRDWIAAHPGQDMDTIAKESGIPNGTVHTYIRVLLRAMLIRMDEDFRYYPVMTKHMKQKLESVPVGSTVTTRGKVVQMKRRKAG